MLSRWKKLESSLYNERKDSWDISKVPDIYDCAKYETIPMHNATARLHCKGNTRALLLAVHAELPGWWCRYDMTHNSHIDLPIMPEVYSVSRVGSSLAGLVVSSTPCKAAVTFV
eukprot:scaffold5321_cov366-Prasinococcus_capsulatus_cf.AAC.11